jgi:glycosyltransferase involved in cell wall biosynthesis
MQENLVSIITPVYNAEKYVSQTIESVLKQSYQDWEMILVNDGSKDNSVDVIQKYVNRDSRIVLVSQDNAGSAAARNNGIRRANGRYFCLLDADDTWESNFLESQLGLMKEKKAQLVYSAYRRIDENSNEILRPQMVKERLTIKDMQRTNHIGCLTGLYDSITFGKIFLKEELNSVRDDYAFWLEIIQKTEVAYGNKNILANYRVLKNSTTGNKKKLIKHQFNFYYKYQKLGLFKSILYTIYWGVLGIFKFN